jgi:Tfp pilus assembly protein PilV
MRAPWTLRHDDRGESLVELITAVAIMGIAVVAIVGGIATSILMTDIHRKQATAGALARSFAEQVEGNYQTSASAYAALFPAQDGYTGSVTSLECWSPSTQQFAAASCPSDLQRVTVTVKSTDDRASESIVVIVRKADGTS